MNRVLIPATETGLPALVMRLFRADPQKYLRISGGFAGATVAVVEGLVWMFLFFLASLLSMVVFPDVQVHPSVMHVRYALITAAFFVIPVALFLLLMSLAFSLFARVRLMDCWRIWGLSRAPSPLFVALTIALHSGFFALLVALEPGITGPENYVTYPEESTRLAARLADAMFYDLSAVGHMVLFGPLAEEVLYRGIVLDIAACRVRSEYRAAAVTSCLFAGMHVFNMLDGSVTKTYGVLQLGQSLLVGYVLCLIRWRRGSLWECVAVHMANNAIAVAIPQHRALEALQKPIILALYLLLLAGYAAYGWTLTRARRATTAPTTTPVPSDAIHLQ